jgi:stage II sporulation protein AA (anti-sigma F factor antagonist)
MKNEDFIITHEKKDNAVKFILKGRVNSLNANELDYKLEEALKEGQKNIVLNMHMVEYLSSAGIRAILKVYKDAKEAGGKFGIEMPSESVKNVLGMTALDEMLIN